MGIPTEYVRSLPPQECDLTVSHAMHHLSQIIEGEEEAQNFHNLCSALDILATIYMTPGNIQID